MGMMTTQRIIFALLYYIGVNIHHVITYYVYYTVIFENIVFLVWKKFKIIVTKLLIGKVKLAGGLFGIH